MMDPVPKSTPQQDIGRIVAVVGTKGWQCCLCNSAFPRSLSMEHHMIINHHPQGQQQTVLPSDNNSTSVGLLPSDYDMSQEQDIVVQDPSGVGGEKENSSSLCRSSCENMEGVGSAPISAEICGNVMSPSVAERSCRMRDGSLVMKVEPNSDSLEATGTSSNQESLPVCFDNKSKQQDINPSSDTENRSSSRQGTSNYDDAEVEAMLCGHKCPSSAGSHPTCRFAHGENSGGACSHQNKRRHGIPRTCDPHKPYKRRTCGCGQEFNSKQEFKYHRRVAHCPCKVFVCEICGAQYLQKRGLNRHLCEKGTVPVACSSCPKQFHDQNSLKEHRKVCHSSEAQNSVPSVSDSMDYFRDQTQDTSVCDQTSHLGTEDPFPWECSKCKKHFQDKRHFRKHLKDCGILVILEGKRFFCCNLCGYSFDWLVEYHRHYVLDHKLAIFSESGSTGSPAHCSPFTGNSPVPSPAPSVTSEINTAMAGVDLNPSRVLNDAESASSFPSTSNIAYSTSSDGRGNEQRRDEADASSSGANLQSQTAAIVCSKPDMHPSSISSSDPLSLTSAVDSFDPLSLTSSSDPVSLTSLTSATGTSRSGPVSFSSVSSSSGQRREGDTIIISDMEDSQSDISSSESDEDWEMVSHHSGEKREGVPTEHQTAEAQEAHREDFRSRSPPLRRSHSPPPPPGHSFPPPPPHPAHLFPPPPPPHPAHSFPPPPPPSPFSDPRFIPLHGHFPPPRHPHHRHHHPRFGHGRFFHGRGMPGPWAFFGASRFSPPNWFCQEDCDDSCATSSNFQRSGTATAASSSHDTFQEMGPHLAPDQESRHPQNDDQSQAASNSEQSANFNPLSFASDFCNWAGKWKEEKKYAKVMWKKVFWNMYKSCQQGGQFLFCPDCLQTFTKESELDKHSQENHPTPREHNCFICQQPYSEAVSYNKHIRQHCETFHMDTRRGRGRGRGHGRMGFGRGMHHIFKWLCKAAKPYDMSNSAQFGQGHTQDTGTDNSPGSSVPEDSKECPVCHKKYSANSRECYFERHVNSHFGVDMYSYKCEECGKKFLEKGKFTAHQAKHKASLFVCEVCGNSYQSKTSLKRHEKIHTGERPHKCPDCGEGFIELRELERHRMKHTGQDPFQCTVCNKGFTLKDSLLNHVRKQHPDKSPVLCIKRAMPLSEMDRKAGSEAQGGSVTVKTEKTSEPQEAAYMELD